jgi:hypothetical protein
MSDRYYVPETEGQTYSNTGGGDIYIDNSNVQIFTGSGEILLNGGTVSQGEGQITVSDGQQENTVFSDAYDLYTQATMPSTREGGAQLPAEDGAQLPPEVVEQTPQDTTQAPPDGGDRVEGQIFADSATRALTPQDLQGLTAEQAKIARNEIYARHGYVFGDEQLRNHFKSQSWYREDPNWDGNLSRMEERNVMAIQNVEFENNFNGARDRFRGVVEPPADTQGMIMPESASKMVTAEQLDQMSAEDIRLARNEIFARHGYQFGYPDMALHFERQSWYRRNSDYRTEDLSWMDHRNINFIAMYEFDNKL